MAGNAGIAATIALASSVRGREGRRPTGDKRPGEGTAAASGGVVALRHARGGALQHRADGKSPSPAMGTGGQALVTSELSPRGGFDGDSVGEAGAPRPKAKAVGVGTSVGSGEQCGGGASGKYRALQAATSASSHAANGGKLWLRNSAAIAVDASGSAVDEEDVGLCTDEPRRRSRKRSATWLLARCLAEAARRQGMIAFGVMLFSMADG